MCDVLTACAYSHTARTHAAAAWLHLTILMHSPQRVYALKHLYYYYHRIVAFICVENINHEIIFSKISLQIYGQNIVPFAACSPHYAHCAIPKINTNS